MTLEQRPEGGRKPEDTWGRRVPGGGNSKYKGPTWGRARVRVRGNREERTCHLKLYFGARKDKAGVRGDEQDKLNYVSICA